VHLWRDGNVVLAFSVQAYGRRGDVCHQRLPDQAFALASVALAIVHWALALSGRVVVGVAGSWAVAMTSLIMTIGVEYLAAASTLQTAPTRSGIMLVQILRPVQILTVGGTACALSVLAWQLVRRRLSVGAHVMARGFVVLGLAGLVFSCAVLALRQAGVLAAPVGLEQTAGVIAELTVDLWISSAVLLLGAVSHAVSSRFRDQPSAA
jgi:hypothetical protein